MKKTAITIGIAVALAVSTAAVMYSRGDKADVIDNKSPVEQSKDSDKKEEEKPSDNIDKEPEKEAGEDKTEDKTDDKTEEKGEDGAADQDEEKKTEETPKSDREDVDNSEGNSRPEAFYVEELIFNFSNLYQAVINKDNIEFSILDNVIMPNSEFSKYASNEIKAYKNQKALVKFETFDIESIKEKGKDSFEVVVNQVISTTIDGKKEERREKAAYMVRYTKEKMGIDQLIIKN